MNNEEIFKVFTEEQQKILANIVETYIDEVDEKLKNLNDNDDWETQIKEYLGAYYLILRSMEFASIDTRILVAKAICEPILQDVMSFTLRFLGTNYFKQKNQKAVEELKRMVGE